MKTEPYWVRADLSDLHNDLNELDDSPVLLIGVIKRLLFEVDRLNVAVARLVEEDR